MASRMFKKAADLTRPRRDAPLHGQGLRLGHAIGYVELLRFMPRRIRRGTFVNAAEMVRRRCPARTKLEDFFNILPKWAFHFLPFPDSLIPSWL
jgi:hypothetical protein